MKFQIYRDKGQRVRWRAKAANRKIMADSGESYTRRNDAYRAVLRFLQLLGVDPETVTIDYVGF